MRKFGISTGILSIAPPGVDVVGARDGSRRLARQINDEAHEIRAAAVPGQYGFFATVPTLHDVEGCLAELRYAFDELSADGVTIFSQYVDPQSGQPTYLGNETFKPIWEELNKRAAVVFIHPAFPADFKLINPQLQVAMMEFPQETARTAMDLILSGRFNQHSMVKIILSHGGGTLPALRERAANLISYSPFDIGLSTEDIIEQASRFYYDTALCGKPALKALLDFAKPGHVLYGSDDPFAPEQAIFHFNQTAEEASKVEKELASLRENALALFPRLRGLEGL